MRQYVYWYSDRILRRYLKDNEVIKLSDAYYKYVVNSIPKVEEWCGCKYNSVLYDSDVDSKEIKTFKERVMNQSHLYFIIVDSDNNVFGHYFPSSLTSDGFEGKIHDSKMFIISLNSFERCELSKYEGMDYHCDYMSISSDDIYYEFYINESVQCSIEVHKIGSNDSVFSSMYIDTVAMSPLGLQTEFIGSNDIDARFTTKRIIVIKMKSE